METESCVPSAFNCRIALLPVTMAAAAPAFDRYLVDYTSARSDALRAIDVFAKCSNPGTLLWLCKLCRLKRLTTESVDTVAVTASRPAKREELVVDARSAIDEVERYVRA